MWNTIKGWFGWVEDEIHHAVSDVQKAVTRLESIVIRKRDIADKKEMEALKAQNAADAARVDASDAAAIGTGLANLIARPSQVTV